MLIPMDPVYARRREKRWRSIPGLYEGKLLSMNSPASSMQLTRGADYAVRIMIHLAGLPENERVLLPALAAASNAPASFLSKILQALTRAELISSRRGQQGGFELLPRGRAASVLEVIEAIDGPVFLNVCLHSQDACGRHGWCPAHPVWQKAQTAMADVLRAAKVADLAAASTQQTLHTILPSRM